MTPTPREGATHAPSWYAATAVPQLERPPLLGAERCDVAIVGGGYTGLSAALHLAEAGRRVVVLEAHRIGWGASGRNGGQAGTGQRRDQDEIERMVGLDVARRLFALAEDAKALVHALRRRHAIACDWRPGCMEVAHHRRLVGGYAAYAEHLQHAYGYDKIAFLDGTALGRVLTSPAYHGGIDDRGAGHLHALNYALGLAAAGERAGARLCEQSAVCRIDDVPGGVRVETARGSVDAEHAILAGNGYLEGLAPAVEGRVMPIQALVVATEPLGAAAANALIANDAAVADSRFAVNYFRRTSDHRLLFGGGEAYGRHAPADIARIVRPRLETVFPQLQGVRLDYAWAGAVAITRSRLPLLARLGPHLLAAGGYSGHGVTIATLAGKLLAEAIRGRSDGFETFAALPNAPFPGGAAARRPLLSVAMSWFALRDRLGL